MIRLALILMILALQQQLWAGQGGLSDRAKLRQSIEVLRAENETYAARNNQLAAEIRDLKEGRDALEEAARSELGLVGVDEEFVIVVDPPAQQPAG